MKVGDKVVAIEDTLFYNKGDILTVFRVIEKIGHFYVHLSKYDNSRLTFYDGRVFVLEEGTYKIYSKELTLGGKLLWVEWD